MYLLGRSAECMQTMQLNANKIQKQLNLCAKLPVVFIVKAVLKCRCIIINQYYHFVCKFSNACCRSTTLRFMCQTSNKGA